MTITVNLNNLSSLYFRQTNAPNNNEILSQLPLLGPIEISQSNVTEGRGLVATRNIVAGECLFVVKPSVEVPIEEVRRVWLSKCKSGDDEIELTKKLEQVAEIILLKKTKRSLDLRQNVKEHRIAAMSILAQVGHHHTEQPHVYDTVDTDVVSNNCQMSDEISSNHSIVTSNYKISNDTILSIIHRNAFGPDFRHYHAIARNWLMQPECNPYGRILSLYPLAAMINHSCKPNAVRVYSCLLSCEKSEIMAVHATQPIQKGEEIVWSYVPTSKPYHDRRKRIKDSFGFDCLCQRCKVESNVFEPDTNVSNELSARFQNYTLWNEKATDINQLPSHDKFRDMIMEFEEMISNKCFTGEVSRYLRSGMLTFYTNYFNVSLSNPTINDEAKLELLNLASKIHLSFAAVDNGNTEHLSTLHLCYELATQQKQKRNLSKFWAGQLQKAHECRYGRLDNDVEQMRKLMVHSRSVLRRQEGFENAQFCFI